MELRGYQRRIADAAVAANTIVMLPTGAGKTLIAAEVMRRVGGTALMFVPTCLLVEQQAAAVRAWTGGVVAEYMGGARLADAFDVLVTTPAAFHLAQSAAAAAAAAAHDSGTHPPRLAWATFSVVVFDEVHHVLKDHPYRKLAASLRRSGAAPRVLGLSASLTYAVVRECAARVRELLE